MKLTFLFFFLTFELLHGQVGIGTNAPEVSAVLDLSSTTQGFLPPRMTNAQMTAIATPTLGLMVYCTDCESQGLYYYDGSYFLNSNSGAISGNLNSFYGNSIVHSGGDLYSNTTYTPSDGLTTSIVHSGWSGNDNHNPINFQSTGLSGYQATLVSFINGGLLENGIIPDSQLSASSNFTGFFPRDGRLNRLVNGSWIAATNNTSQWYQVDLGQIETVIGVATQGRHNAPQWIETYRIQYSNDNSTFTDYNGSAILTGNNDQFTVVRNDFSPTFSARYVRFLPQMYNNHVSSRFEVYIDNLPGLITFQITGRAVFSGLPAPTFNVNIGGQSLTFSRTIYIPSEVAAGVESGAIPDSQLSASSVVNTTFSASDGRLNKVAGNNWVSSGLSSNEWFQVDLGQIETVSAVATQGRNSNPQWITSYTIEYSDDGSNFTNYNGGVVLTGNTDQNTVVKNDFSPTFTARYVRFRADTWNIHIAGRFEVYILR